MCAAMKQILGSGKSAQELCALKGSVAESLYQGGPTRGSDEFLPYCGRLGSVVGGQKQGVAPAGKRAGGDTATALQTCAKSAWEAACESGDSNQYNYDPLDVGYGQKAYAPVPYQCYCHLVTACAEGPVLGLTAQTQHQSDACTPEDAAAGRCRAKEADSKPGR
jgi:hypothetical protein